MLILTVSLWQRVECIASPVVIEKNLFHPERRPVILQRSKTHSKMKPFAKAIQLDAVFYFEDQKVALIRVDSSVLGIESPSSGSPYIRVQEKETVGNIQVVAIEPAKIILRDHGSTFEVPLFQEGKLSPPPITEPVLPVSTPQKDSRIEEGSPRKLGIHYYQKKFIQEGRLPRRTAQESTKLPQINDDLEELLRAIENLQGAPSH